jgi:carboxymethylenebutenolidase
MHKFTVKVLLALLVNAPVFAQQREEVEIAANGGRMLTGVLFLPEGGKPAPAVVVLHTAFGSVESFDEEFARALAMQGFVALAPNYIHPSLAKSPWSPAITADMSKLVDYLQGRPESKDMPVGTVGFSLGSRGILLAARRSEVTAVVVYYGTFDIRKEKGIKLAPKAQVPMTVADQVNAAVLLLHGVADDEIPVASAREMKAAMEAAGKKVELVEYPGAHHRFDRGPNERMRGERTKDGYIYRKNDAAAKDAFDRTVKWLKSHLRPAP